MTTPEDIYVVIVAHGTIHDGPAVRRMLAGGARVYAADGGANWLVDRGLSAHVLVGDLDSARDDVVARLESAGCEVQRHDPDKNETDTELTLRRAASDGHRRIVLLGAMGSRADHSLANLSLLGADFLVGREVRVFDGRTEGWLVRQRQVVHGEPGDVVSVIPAGGDAVGVRTSGLQYALSGDTLQEASPRGVSNVMTAAEAVVSVEGGRMYVFHVPACYAD